MKSYKKFLILFFINSLLLNTQDLSKKPPKKSKNNGKSQSEIFYTDVPEQDFNIILGRSGKTNITMSILTYKNIKGYFEYGNKKNEYIKKTKEFEFEKDVPVEIEIKNLESNTRYYYRFCFNNNKIKKLQKSPEYTFQTQKDKDSEFVFAVQADSHLDNNTDTKIYEKTLENVLLDNPDFYIDLGDTFMTNKYRDNYKDSLKQYLAQRYYFGLLCNSTPLFLVLGNHDGESKRENGKQENMTVWATNMRKFYYPNPFPDGFYSGNDIKESVVGLPENYYAWEWGDALFVVLDPFRYSNSKSNSSWDRTLGEKQYNWLKNTLQNSKAKFKFVFIHNLVGGVDKNGKARGGAEAANFYEWGGLNGDGSKGFSKNRPGWSNSIHELFVKNKVSVVFHGHDHFFAKQDFDGIVYQLVPQPGSKNYDNIKSAAEYGYINGTILNGPGYIRITVSPDSAKIDYVRTYLNDKNKNKEIAYFYTLKP